MSISLQKSFAKFCKRTKRGRTNNRLNSIEQFEARILFHGDSLLAYPDESPASEVEGETPAAEMRDLHDEHRQEQVNHQQGRQKNASLNLVTVRGEERREGEPIRFNFEIINRDDQTLKITYRIIDGDKPSGNANRHSDYMHPSGDQTITIAPGGVGGIQSHQISVNTVDDRKVEPDEELKLEIINVQNGAVNGTGFNADYTYGKILNDDTGIEITSSVVGYEQGSGSRMVFTVRATEPEALKFNNPISAQAVIENGSATADLDFKSAQLPGTVHLDHQTPSVQYVVSALSDNVSERTENFLVALKKVTGSIDLGASNLKGRGLINDGAAPANPIQKVAIIGNQFEDDDSNFSIALADLNGKLDEGFGTHGIVTTDIGGYDVAQTVVVQDDGKIIVAGTTDAENIDEDVALVRYNVDGSLDTDFGNDGIAVVDVGGRDYVDSITLGPDGVVVLAVSSTDPLDGYSIPAILKFTSLGNLDASFGNGGLVYTQFDESAIARTIDFDVDSGSFLFTGSLFDDDGSRGFVSRIDEVGDFQTFFNDGSFFHTIDIGDVFLPEDVEVKGDSIYLAATVGTEGNFDSAVLKFDNGLVDAEWGDNGLVLVDLDSNEFVRDIEVDDDGGVLVAGVTNAHDPFLDAFFLSISQFGASFELHVSPETDDVYELENGDGVYSWLSGSFGPSLELSDLFLGSSTIDDIREHEWGPQTELANLPFYPNDAKFVRGIDADDLGRRIDEFFAETTNPVLDLMDSTIFNPLGDSTNDGRFDTGDLVRVFQRGLYETGEVARQEDGDWNGDGLFDSADVIKVFQAGQFEQPPQISDDERETITEIARLSDVALNHLETGDLKLARDAISGAEFLANQWSFNLVVPGMRTQVQFSLRTTFTDPEGTPITAGEAAETGEFTASTPEDRLRVPGPGGTTIVLDGATRKDTHRRKGAGVKRVKTEIEDADGKTVTTTETAFDALGRRTGRKTKTTDPNTGKERTTDETFNPATGKPTSKEVTEKNNGGVKVHEETTTYDAAGNVSMVDTTTRNDNGVLTGKTKRQVGAACIVEVDTYFDGMGNKTREIRREYDPRFPRSAKKITITYFDAGKVRREITGRFDPATGRRIRP